jgi:hypothetical protein
LIAASAFKESWDQAKQYIYAEQIQQKRRLKKHLLFRSVIYDGCNENFTNDCAELAQHFALMEKYYADDDEMWCLKYQANIVEKKDCNILEAEFFIESEKNREENSNKLPYFQSLSLDEQKKLLALQRKLVIEHAQSKNYKQELENIHIALAERY